MNRLTFKEEDGTVIPITDFIDVDKFMKLIEKSIPDIQKNSRLSKTKTIARALKELKTEKLCDQILFHTDKSLQYLKYINTEVKNYEKNYFNFTCCYYCVLFHSNDGIS